MDAKTPADINDLAQKVTTQAKSTISWKRKIKTRWPEWLSLAANALALVAVLSPTSFSPTLLANHEAFFQIVVIDILFIFFLVLLAWQIYTFARKSRYAEAMPYLHAIIHNTRDAVYELHRGNPENSDIKYFAMLNLTFLSQVFGMITGAKCRASVKMFREASEEEVENAFAKYKELNLKEFKYLAETFARDAESAMLCSEVDGLIKNWILANTDFKTLMNAPAPQTERFFISNNLPKDTKYQSTSFDLYGNSEIKWSLPYRSTMVWPIRKITKPEERAAAQPLQKQDLIGFLCVDSYAVNVFEARYDFDLGALVADNFYMLLASYRAKMTKQLPMKRR